MRNIETIIVMNCLLLALVLGGCSKQVIINPTVEDAMLKVFEQRQYSESAVQMGVERSKADPAAVDIVKLRRLYEDAAAKGNAFIELVELKLTAGSLAESDLKPKAEAVVMAVQELQAYAYPTKGLPVSELIAGMITGLTNAGIAIWKETKNQEAQVLDRTKKELESRKWKKWNQLQP